MSDLREKLFYEQKNGYDLIDTGSGCGSRSIAGAIWPG